jgi:hypothetical protein
MAKKTKTGTMKMEQASVSRLLIVLPFVEHVDDAAGSVEHQKASSEDNDAVGAHTSTDSW